MMLQFHAFETLEGHRHSGAESVRDWDGATRSMVGCGPVFEIASWAVQRAGWAAQWLTPADGAETAIMGVKCAALPAFHDAGVRRGVRTSCCVVGRLSAAPAAKGRQINAQPSRAGHFALTGDLLVHAFAQRSGETLDRYSSVLAVASSYRSCIKDPKSCTQRDGLHPLSGCPASCQFLNRADSLKFPLAVVLASSRPESTRQAGGPGKARLRNLRTAITIN